MRTGAHHFTKCYDTSRGQSTPCSSLYSRKSINRSTNQQETGQGEKKSLENADSVSNHIAPDDDRQSAGRCNRANLLINQCWIRTVSTDTLLLTNKLTILQIWSVISSYYISVFEFHYGCTNETDVSRREIFRETLAYDEFWRIIEIAWPLYQTINRSLKCIV